MLNQLFGKRGEMLAKNFLLEKGWSFVGENIRTPFGEIDLIFAHQDEIIFIEVKSRHSAKFGFPEESVNARKISHLTKSAEYYIEKHKITLIPRFDIIAIISTSNNNDIQHFSNII
jgi:putative endonuclease